jgi:hypothetical protein
MFDHEIRQAMDRYQARLREAEQDRLYEIALEANGRRGYLRKRVAVRLGVWMIAVGRRLEAQNGRDGFREASPASPTPRPAPQQFVASWNRVSQVGDCGD